jgi:ribosomal protein L10
MHSKNYFKAQLLKKNETKGLVLFVQYSDYTVKEWDLFKGQIAGSDFTITRIKNTDMLKRLSGSSYTNLGSSFHGSMAVISCSQQFSPKLLKRIIKIIEEQSKLLLVCGLLNKEIVFPGTLTKWSELPEDTELYLTFTSLVKKPIQKVLSISNQGMNMVCSDLDKHQKLGD